MLKILKKSGGLIFILGLALFLFYRAIGFELLNWDDQLYISQNELVNGEAGINKIFTESFEGHYHPLVLLSLRLDFRIASGEPWVFHLHNILLHLLNVLLLWLVLRRLFRNSWLPFLITLIFAIHPLQVEVVAWATARKDLLYAFWFLLSLFSWIAYRQEKRIRWFWGALLFFLLSCLSKAQAVMLAPLLLLIDYQFFKEVKLRQSLISAIPFLLIAVVFGIIAIWAQKQTGYTSDASFDTPLIWMLGNAAFALWSYVFRFFLPLGLSAYYPYPVPGEDISAFLFWGALPLAMVFLALIIWLVKNRKLSGFGILFFLVLLLPMLRLLPVSNFITADRYTYLAIIGFFIGVYALFTELGEKWWRIFFLVFALLLALTTSQRLTVWEDSESLLNDVLDQYPDVYPALNSRADIYLESQRFEEAISDLEHAIQIRPEAARAWRNRGLAYAIVGNNSSALADLSQALQIVPDHVGTLINRARVYEMLGDTSAAMDDLKRALELDAGNVTALLNRATLYLKMDKIDEAEEDLDLILRLNPGHPPALASYGLAMNMKEEYSEAITYLQKALESGYYHPLALQTLSRAYIETDQAEKAIGIIESLMADRPGDPENHALLCRYLSKIGNYSVLEQAAERWLELETGNATAYFFRGYARLRNGMKEAGCRDLDAALMLGYGDAKDALEEFCESN